MTVDETPVSPPNVAPTMPKPTLAKKQSQAEQISPPLVEGRPVPMQQPDEERPMSFENFIALHPKNAESKLNQLSEVTGLKDRSTLVKAFNKTRVGNYEFPMAEAVEWILNLQSESSKSFLPDFGQPVEPTNRKTSRIANMSPANITHNPVTAVSSVASHSSGPGGPPNSPNSSIKPLVDLTETSPGSKDNIDIDLEKAIKLSLEEANRTSVGFGGGGISQEEQDVSRALEASLMENQLGGGKRKRAENWIDPLNPHDRERDRGLPVGLKNVGQTCWFSAVIQSLFYLPAFRSLVLNYRPRETSTMTSDIVTNIDEDSNKRPVTSSLADRERKIVEFMQELRRLFALMVASKRKYVDPSRAVDILRGSIGCGNGTSQVPANLNNSIGGLSNLGMSDNDQQDVSEFTHIVLEWVEEAFKHPEGVQALKSDLSHEMMEEGSNDQAEKENNEEKEVIKTNNELNINNTDDNPMAKLFYGKVLTEGSIQGEVFSRTENFGQWPLQVNSFTHIHDSLENSTAHEYLNVSTTVGDIDDSGQERWFINLPPVLFLELSRFQYNTERRVAEKIHNRLEFPDSIYMDRYMSTNKHITRSKRDHVRTLKEKRRLLKEGLDKFSQYGSSTENKVTPSTPGQESACVNGRMSLPEVLQHTLAFAMSGCSMRSDASMSSPAQSAIPKSMMAATSVMMQVDSPCHSPKMTPASSLSNLAVTSTLPFTLDQDDCPMEVEGSDEPTPVAVTFPQTHSEIASDNPTTTLPLTALEDDVAKSQISSSVQCDVASTTSSSLTTLLDTVPDPAPKSITEAEMKVLQSCLTRWKREVEEDMETLEKSIKLVDKAIEDMYDSVEELRKLEFALHAVMVHEGSIDSGHYWAYVRDHARKVWLKFNDNTVSEVTWEELLKESVGGTSNTSAYSLVYIDASKPELLMDSHDKMAQTEEGEDRMDEGKALDCLLETLPQDLSDFVSTDNEAFRQEIITWDKEQLEKQRAALEAAAAAKIQKQQQTEPMSTSDPNNDVQVVQEKLTHTNTHARLSLDLSHRFVKRYENTIHEKGVGPALTIIVEKTIQNFVHHISKNPELANQQSPPLQSGVAKSSNDDLAESDIRLESFVAYLLKNGLSPQSNLVELAVLEQYAHPGLEINDCASVSLRKCAEQFLNQKRQRFPDDAKELRDWHQIYHWFRRSAHCFVNGLESLNGHQFDKALDLFTEAYQYTMKVQDTRPGGPLKAIRAESIVRYLCLTLPEVNEQLVKQFALGEELSDIVNMVQQLIVPGLTILQTRINNGMSMSAAQTLEDIRNDWCALLGDAKDDARTSALTEVLTFVLEEASQQVPVRLSKNGEFVNLNADLKLSTKYKEMLARLQQELNESQNIQH